MARDALVALAACLVMSVLFDSWRVRAVRRIRTMAIEAQRVRRLPQERIVVRTVRIMATEASDAVRVHQAGYEVVALHAILVRSPVGEMGESRLPNRMLFQLP